MRNIFPKRSWWPAVAGTLLLLTLLPPLLAHRFYDNGLELNSFLILNLQQKHGVDRFSTTFNLLSLSYGDGLNKLINRPRRPASLPSGQMAFDTVFAWLPSYIKVYPTEEFFYFSGMTADYRQFAGNLRLADLASNKVSFSFYPVDVATSSVSNFPYMQDEIEGKRVLTSLDLTNADGLTVKHLFRNFWLMNYSNKKVLVELPDQDWVKSPPSMTLLPEEEFVGRILDESGTRLFLIYNHETKSFYDVLDEANLLESLESLDANHWLGKRTGFLYFGDPDYQRKILVGVYWENVWANNFLDGPGDQVPIHLDLKNKLNEAYPNTLLGDGIDEHGVFLNKNYWVRIAISPYQFYLNPYEVIRGNEQCLADTEVDSKSALWACITKEAWMI